jgi:hypothetical protein
VTGPGPRAGTPPTAVAAAGLLLAAPTVLAFFTGGYFAPARTIAGAAMWLLVALTLLGARPDRGRSSTRATVPAVSALAALAGLAVWTGLSITWAPIAGRAYGATQITTLYLGAVLAAYLLARRSPIAVGALEPALALGITIVTGYGLAERLLPGLLHYSRSVSAQGRLEQPLTYWNAMGELAALGLVLVARLAGDPRRPRAIRRLAAAAAAPLGAALYVSFSRGALFAALAGLVTVTVAAPSRAQARATAVALGAAILAAAAIGPLHGVTNLHGRLSSRETQGAIALGVLVLLGSLAAAVPPGGAEAAARLKLPRRSGWIAAGIVCAGLALAIALGAKERSGVPLSGGAQRLVSLQSNRYAYWNVALKAFAHAPLNGVGAGGWSVWWLRDRPYPDGASNAHSLELETLAELGLVGAALLAAWLAATGLAAREAHRRDPAATAGLLAVFVTWLAHTPLDWDWQMPAVTLIAMCASGALLALPSRE